MTVGEMPKEKEKATSFTLEVTLTEYQIEEKTAKIRTRQVNWLLTTYKKPS